MSFVAHPNIDPKSLGKVGVLLGGRPPSARSR
jgi:D-alanine-D-alanine ligase